MELKVIQKSQFENKLWDQFVFENAGNYQHLSTMIDYLSAFSGFVDVSFSVFEKNELVAIVVLLYDTKNNTDFFSTPNGDLPIILIKRETSAGRRRKIFRECLSIIESLADGLGKKHILFSTHPFVFHNSLQGSFSFENSCEVLAFHPDNYVLNSITISLASSETELLDNCTPDHRKNIRQGLRSGIKIVSYSASRCNVEILNMAFNTYQEMHLTKAKGHIRAPLTYEIMQKMLLENQASVHISFFENRPVSSLFVGEFANYSFGWSQVNDETFNDINDVRHSLEFSAIVDLKSRNFSFYEVGRRFYGQTGFFQPTEKQIKMTAFKERFGGILLPRIYSKISL